MKRHLGTLSLYIPTATTCRQQSATDQLDMTISPTVFLLCSILISPTSLAPAPAPNAPASPAGGCLSDQGCPASHPVCSEWGYCQDASYKPPPTTSITQEASPAPTLAPIYEDLLAEIYKETTSDLVEKEKYKDQISSSQDQGHLEELLAEIYKEPTSDLKEKYEDQSSSSETLAPTYEDLLAEIYEEPTSDLVGNEKYKDQRSSSEDQSQLEDLLINIFEEPTSDLKEKYEDQSSSSENKSQLEDLLADIYEEPTSDLIENEKYKDQRSFSEDQRQLEELLVEIYEEPPSDLKQKYEDQSFSSENQSQLEDLLADIYEEPSSDLIEKEKFDDQSSPSEVQSQLVSACSSNADCPQDNPVCSEWGHCQCASYQSGGTACWDLAAPTLELL